MKKLSRMEANKEVRHVLSRHHVDLSYTQYSCIGRDIRISGELIRTDGDLFQAFQVEALISDLKRTLPGFMIWGDCKNWNFTIEHITKISVAEIKQTYDLEDAALIKEDDHNSDEDL